MALATRCPNCHALFRVVADQLKLRGGLVRCGACQHVFDAIGTLSYIDDVVLPAGNQTPAMPAAGTHVGTTAPPPFAAPRADAAPAESRPPQESPPADKAQTGRDAELPEPSDADSSATSIADAAMNAEPELVATAIPDNESTSAGAQFGHIEPLEAVAEQREAEPAAPSFLRDESSTRRRGFSILFGSGAVLLALLALAQLAALFRADILVKLPQSRPALVQLCKVFRCMVNWPARGELLAVVGSELQALPGTSAFELSAVVRNRGAYTLALPAIELTLTDTLNRTVARKVFAPVDYLAGQADPQAHLLAGLAPGADLTISIAFEARGLSAAGFVVYPFYL